MREMSEVERSWTEPLLLLFDLLVENADGIVDDTSLERVLEWLNTVCKSDQLLPQLLQCGVVETFSSERIFANASSTAFFLRLFGYLASRCEVLHSLKCGKDGDFLAWFFEEPRRSPGLWSEGIVRNGYFQALSPLTELESGISWLRDSGHVDSALDCICDRSMFVAYSARQFIAKYLVGEMSVKMHDHFCLHTLQNTTCNNDKLVAVVYKLKGMLHLGSLKEETASSSRIAVAEVVRALLFESSAVGQRILQETGLFADCLRLVECGHMAVCTKLVDVVCEMAKNTRTWSLEWDRLSTQRDSNETSASSVLLGLCVELFRKGLISGGLELTAGLGPCQESWSLFPVRWLEALFDIIEVPVDMILNQSCCQSERNRNGHQINGDYMTDSGNLDMSELLEYLMSAKEGVNILAKQQLQSILFPWIEQSPSHTRVICQALVAATKLTQQFSSSTFSRVLDWIRRSEDLIKRSIGQTKQSSNGLYGDHKVLKASLEYISSFADIQTSRDLFEHVDSLLMKHIFESVVGTLLHLAESSECSATVISMVLKTLEKFLKTAQQDFIDELFRSETARETICKQQKLESHSMSEEQGSLFVVDKAPKLEKLAFVLYRRLRDPRWEVRDSTLEFIDSMVRLKNDFIVEFLCHHKLPAVVWDATDDCESYVRATALDVIGSLSSQSSPWACLLRERHLSEVDVLNKVLSLLLTEDEAFPRRKAMDCVVLWVTIRHPIASRILNPNSSTCEETNIQERNSVDACPEVQLNAKAENSFELKTDESVVEDASDPLPTGTPPKNITMLRPGTDDAQNQELNENSDFGVEQANSRISRTVCRACQDFDWEVKLRGLQFWEAVINYFTGIKGASTNANEIAMSSWGVLSEQFSTSSLNEGIIKSRNTDKCLEVLHDMGGLRVLTDALSDCDHMVCERALMVLTRLQSILPQQSPTEERPIETCGEFHDALGQDFSLDKFKQVLRVTDFQALVQSSVAADISLRSDPTSLIEDILIAAKQTDSNLLDCY